MTWTKRTELLLGAEKIKLLKTSHVLIAGLGGVGGYAAEQLARAGIGHLTIVDGDVVQSSNRNRQIIALVSNEGKNKAQLFAERLRDINPDIKINVIDEFISDEQMDQLLEGNFDYAVDCIDTMSPKLHFIYQSMKRGIPLVSSMGAGGKLDPTLVEVADISESVNCRLAHYLRKRLRKMDIHSGFKVVFSPEQVDPATVLLTFGEKNKKSTVGTISYMPPVFGCCCASVVIRGIIGDRAE